MEKVLYLILGLILLDTITQDGCCASERSSEDFSTREGRRLMEETTRFSNKELDVLFVIDRSKSISIRGWQNIINFIYSLLEHFTVSRHNTRIAVITFSTNASIDINDLEDGKENKCSLIQKFKKRLRIKIPFGYTSTNEGLEKAIKVLYKSRFSAKKIVIVMTDGRSNLGPPPIRASLEMRSLRWNASWNEKKNGPQLEIFAFGVHDVDMMELQTIASPLPNHTFHIQHFSQFQQMAKNIHRDEQKETWELVDKPTCDEECSKNAVCMCATKSGQYLCVCNEGYEGDGRDCKACDIGFYKDSSVPYSCWPCPDNMTTLYTGATARSNCVCKLGYYKDGSNCSYRVCSDLPEIRNGNRFHVDGQVHDEVIPSVQPCLNTPGTSCHYRCNTGYRLSGHPGLVCQADGNWNGKVPECKIVDCKTLEYHDEAVDHGSVEYVNITTTYQSVLTTTCDRGWRIFGDINRYCTEFGFWSGTRATCVEAKCPALQLGLGMTVFPSNCSSVATYPGTICQFQCRHGFKLEGQGFKTCSSSGTWLGSTVANCKDIESPIIKCPEDLTLPVSESNFGVVFWKNQQPETNDNSGETTIIISGVKENPAHMTVGYHFIKYTVEDRAGNRNSCTRQIHIVGRTVSVESCPTNVTDLSVSGMKKTVYWNTPVFVDNNGRNVAHQCSRNSGSTFLIGSYNVICIVKPEERLHNPPSCSFSILLQRKKCDVPPAPLHGSVTCNSGTDVLTVCSVKCNNGYDFFNTPQIHYKCDLSGNWILRTPGQFWPDCSRSYHPRRAKMKGLAEFFYYSGRCERNKDRIERQFKNLVQKFAWDICGENSCNIRNITVKCGMDSRKRRSANKLSTPEQGIGDLLNPSSPFIDLDTSSDDKDITDYKVLDIRASDAEESLHYKRKTDIVSKPENEVSDYVTMFTSPRTRSVTSSPKIDKPTANFENGITSPAVFKTDIVKQKDFTTVSEDNSFESETMMGNVETLKDVEIGTTLIESIFTTPSYFDLSKLLIQFEVQAELNLTYITHHDLETLVDSLWDVFDNLKVENITLEQSDGNNMILYSEKMEFGDPAIGDCLEGYLTVESSWFKHCVGCPRGTRLLKNLCVPCDIGYYQDKEAQIQCICCPLNTTTIKVGSTNITDCTEQCPPGKMSTNGYEPCLLCDEGYYQEDRGEKSCDKCANDTSSSFSGATNVGDCIDVCPVGTFNKVNGLVPCEMCPTGMYQPNSKSTNCLYCPDNTTTITTGSSKITYCSDFDPCENITVLGCENNGTCISVMEDDVLCSCLSGFNGDRCEINIDDCLSSPCRNNATCIDGINDYSCTCSEGFEGNDCGINVDVCVNNTCSNGGSCLDLEVGFACYCSSGFTGPTCDLPIDSCLSNLCMHGNCISQTSGYYCSCRQGFAGKLCDVIIKYTCYQIQCYNGGVCQVDGDTSRCHCLPGFTGIFCEINNNECKSSPCLNQATCIDLDNRFYCKCKSGYTGRFCQDDISEDFDLIFDGNLDVGYVRLPSVVIPKLKTFTVTFWFLVFQTDFGSLFSYNVRSQNSPEIFEEVIKFEGGQESYALCINGACAVSTSSLPAGIWNHVVIDWSSIHGAWHIYINGTIRSSGFRLAEESILKSKGSFVLGIQEDFYGGTQNIWKSYSGELSRFNVYDYILNEDEIAKVSNQTSCYNANGNILSWTDAFSGISGEITIRNQSYCLDIDECLLYNPCKDYEVCKNQVDSYSCECKAGFKGIDCKETVNECNTETCKNNGICSDGNSLYDVTCTCQPGYTGRYCEFEDKDGCNSSSCVNGKCVQKKEGHVCECRDNWRGSNCDIMYDSSCELSPCLFNSTCVPDIKSSGKYKCVCPRFDSMVYDKNCLPLSCISSPCLNGGSCYDNYDATFTCKCVDGYSGEVCDEVLSPVCTSTTCFHGGTCLDYNGTVTCHCVPDYIGQWCEIKIENKNKNYKDSLSAVDERVIIFCSLGVIVIFIIVTASILGCKMCKEKRKYHPRRLLSDNLNNSPSPIGINVVNNPVFNMEDEATRQGTPSGTYENMYAELGDFAYADDIMDIKNNQAKAKECNLERATDRKNSESSYTSVRSSNKSLKRFDADYLQPIFTRNEFEYVDDVPKDCKVLLPMIGKNIRDAPIPVDESEYVPPSLPQFHKYQNTTEKCQPNVTEKNPLLLDEQKSNEPPYINTSTCSLIPYPCLPLQKYIIDPNVLGSSNQGRGEMLGYVNERFHLESSEVQLPELTTRTQRSNLDDGKTKKPFEDISHSDDDKKPIDASFESPTYLSVVEPKPGELPGTKSKHVHIEPCKRKLPPLPKNR
ncbi:sushi, von Willebrand factor type A, EGF and pentraxin domain-containing protein 1 [Patella vulgata]|uniref:sushi, von Willebrand factor type A, EGF and pentraxin domain-containing protein 1 n=1 Tax=Patella vulgata TaxID=6465 RepID=UPI0024A82CE5|nr:sushi, von Willebrand factor type A, EGF and pentraxin domain-containing protein 1 [Patella vulgata]